MELNTPRLRSSYFSRILDTEKFRKVGASQSLMMLMVVLNTRLCLTKHAALKNSVRASGTMWNEAH
jgi:hypothetical protein